MTMQSNKQRRADRPGAVGLEDAALDTAAGGYNPKEIAVDKDVPWKSGSSPKLIAG